jgi:hypothetical protein
MPDPLTAEFADDQTTIEKPKAANVSERRLALLVCLDEVWPGVDIGTLERIDDTPRKLHGWAMWPK